MCSVACYGRPEDGRAGAGVPRTGTTPRFPALLPTVLARPSERIRGRRHAKLTPRQLGILPSHTTAPGNTIFLPPGVSPDATQEAVPQRAGTGG